MQLCTRATLLPLFYVLELHYLCTRATLPMYSSYTFESLKSSRSVSSKGLQRNGEKH